MTCFACGLECESLAAAHILPRRIFEFEDRKDADTEINLHLLCEVCHVSSENLIGNAYWYWMDLMRQCYTRGRIELQNIAAMRNGTLALVVLSGVVIPSRVEKAGKYHSATNSFCNASTNEPYVYEDWMEVHHRD